MREANTDEVVGSVTAVAAIVAIAAFAGCGYEVLMLWLLPTRIALFLVALVFVFLPHYPGVVSQQDDPFMATRIKAYHCPNLLLLFQFRRRVGNSMIVSR